MSEGSPRNPVVLLMGPTASGKSALAMALAERLPVEIVSVDSAQVYRGMDVGTAKPSRAERARVAHHLVDIVDPTDAYSAAAFVRDATHAIGDIHARGRIPLLVGGTMLYFRALTHGLSALPAANPAVRAALDARAAVEGWPALHGALAGVDPVTARRLDPLDRQRIQRALEVFELTGRPMSALLGEPSRSSEPADRFIRIALMPGDRAVLHRRIAERFDAMLAAGLVDELRALRRRCALTQGLPSMRAVGYRQAWQHLDGQFDTAALRDRGIYATRQLAKRQLTWLRATHANRFDPLTLDHSRAIGDLLALALER
jgi:tRNA dimethylallyltransferase